MFGTCSFLEGRAPPEAISHHLNSLSLSPNFPPVSYPLNISNTGGHPLKEASERSFSAGMLDALAVSSNRYKEHSSSDKTASTAEILTDDSNANSGSYDESNNSLLMIAVGAMMRQAIDSINNCDEPPYKDHQSDKLYDKYRSDGHDAAKESLTEVSSYSNDRQSRNWVGRNNSETHNIRHFISDIPTQHKEDVSAASYQQLVDNARLHNIPNFLSNTSTQIIPHSDDFSHPAAPPGD